MYFNKVYKNFLKCLFIIWYTLHLLCAGPLCIRFHPFDVTGDREARPKEWVDRCWYAVMCFNRCKNAPWRINLCFLTFLKNSLMY